MLWWGWLVLGIGLLGIEMFVIDAQFYLVFLGAAATVVGLLTLAGVPMPEWLQWLVFAGLSVVAMTTFRKHLYERLRGRPGTVQQPVTLGDSVIVPVRLEPNQTCRVNYRGSSWTARNVDRLPIEAGTEAPISRVDDLTLHVISPATG